MLNKNEAYLLIYLVLRDLVVAQQDAGSVNFKKIKHRTPPMITTRFSSTRHSQRELNKNEAPHTTNDYHYHTNLPYFSCPCCHTVPVLFCSTGYPTFYHENVARTFSLLLHTLLDFDIDTVFIFAVEDDDSYGQW
jgi:hypothetical protein